MRTVENKSEMSLQAQPFPPRRLTLTVVKIIMNAAFFQHESASVLHGVRVNIYPLQTHKYLQCYASRDLLTPNTIFNNDSTKKHEWILVKETPNEYNVSIKS